MRGGPVQWVAPEGEKVGLGAVEAYSEERAAVIGFSRGIAAGIRAARGGRSVQVAIVREYQPALPAASDSATIPLRRCSNAIKEATWKYRGAARCHAR
jgi:hypothetical protein